MTTIYAFNENHAEHARLGHPERPARLQAIMQSGEVTELLARLERVAARAASDEELLAVHTTDHLRRVEAAARAGRSLDADTYTAGPASLEAARHAAGAVTELALRIARGDATRGLALVRPPGHHAEANRAMGFCLFNNVAVAARAVIDAGLVRRVSIFDWDVHHGNGTQAIFESDPDVQYISIHQQPLYPGTGGRGEMGTGAGAGTTVNVPLPAGSRTADYLAAFDDIVAPALRQFGAEIILGSAGFDAHEADPLANMALTAGGFAALTRRVRDVADEVCAGRLVVTLEGGYDLEALPRSVAATLKVLMDENPA